MSKPKTAPKVLHLHSTFAAGGKELRAVHLMNAFGKELEHTIASGQPEHMEAMGHVVPRVPVRVAQDFPSLTGWPTPGRLLKIAQAMKGHDLVLTYNWGAMDAVLAHTIFAKLLDLPPLIHHEDGFNEDEADGLKKSRNWMRQFALTGAHALVVPSQVLEKIALDAWAQPRSLIKRIPNGIDTKTFGKAPKPGSLRVIKREGERWIGTLAGLRAVKQLPVLVEAFSGLDDIWHLVILGDGPERDAIEAKAAELEVNHRVHMPGAVKDPASVIGLFDIFALSSKSEQFPLSVVEAMAAGLPVATPDVGDVRAILAPENHAFIAVPGDTAALAQVIGDLASNELLRAEVGKANREKARANFDQSAMIDAYRALYWDAIGRA